MGSLMSFPLLCLTNKVVVDLALADLAEAGKITWEEFRVHRCLINGDDLAYREPKAAGSRLLDGILHHGTLVGLKVNKEKTMVSPDEVEINSTVFKSGRKQKKTNVAVVKWSSEVTDPVGFLADSVVKASTFRRLLRDWRIPIRNARRKVQGPLPPQFFKELWRCKEIREALTWTPALPPARPNPFPVVTKPAGYSLTRREEVCYISERVARLREMGYRPPLKSQRHGTISGVRTSVGHALRKEKPCGEERILRVLADAWQAKVKQQLYSRYLADGGVVNPVPGWCQECYEGSHSKIQCLTGKIKMTKEKWDDTVPDCGRRSAAVGEPTPVAEFIRV